MNWEKDDYLHAVGVNYSDPNKLGSDVVVSNSNPILLNDYKEKYIQNPNKVIADLTNELERLMQDQLTHVKDKEWSNFHEYVMRLTKKGMNAVDYDKDLKLLERWNYSRNLANWVNVPENVENENLMGLRVKLAVYFDRFKTSYFDEIHLTQLYNKSFNKVNDLLYFLFLAPVFLIGLIHNFPAYLWVKRFVEKSFKRKVFWGSVKMLMGALINGVYNILLVLLLNKLIFQSAPIAWTYFLIVPPLSGVIAYSYAKKIQNFKIMQRLKVENVSDLLEQRTQLIQDIKTYIPVA